MYCNSDSSNIGWKPRNLVVKIIQNRSCLQYWVYLNSMYLGTELVDLNLFNTRTRTLEFGFNWIKMEIETWFRSFFVLGSILKFLPHQIMYADVTHLHCSNMNQNASSMIYKKLEKIWKSLEKWRIEFLVIK